MSSTTPKLEGKEEFTPPKTLTFFIACLITSLAILAILLISVNSQLKAFLPYLGYAVFIVFVARAIGDFKYLDFFKKIYNSSFSKKDTFYFSPLCLVLGAAFIALSGQQLS